MAALITTRVLAEHFGRVTLIERDVLRRLLSRAGEPVLSADGRRVVGVPLGDEVVFADLVGDTERSAKPLGGGSARRVALTATSAAARHERRSR
jgi:hypothetical protein